MKSVRSLWLQQRDRHAVMRIKQTALREVLRRVQKTSKSAVRLMEELQSNQEECLSIGGVVCSEIQHSVADCDPDSLAVAGSVAAIELATVGVARAGTAAAKLRGLVAAMQGSSDDVIAQQRETDAHLCAMYNAHCYAIDTHSLAAIDEGLGHMDAETPGVLCCASCNGDAEAVYAARTGMCKTCHEKASDAVDCGWVRCVEMEDAV